MVKAMKFCFNLITFIILIPNLLISEPFLLHQAFNIVKANQLEAGLDVLHTYEKYEIAGNTDEYVQEYFNGYLFARYGLKDNIELYLSAPYSYNIDKQTGKADAIEQGIGQSIINVKWNVWKRENIEGLSFIGLIEYPTGNSKKGLSEGLNYGVELAFDTSISVIEYVHINIGYKITGEYENELLTKINKGDILNYGIGVEPLREFSLIPEGKTTVIIELLGTSYGNYKLEGAEQTGTNGSTLEAIGAIRYDTGNLKTKLGFALQLGDISNRSYAWKILGGVSCLFQF